MEAAGDQFTEHRILSGLLVEMKRLRVELLGELDDLSSLVTVYPPVS